MLWKLDGCDFGWGGWLLSWWSYKSSIGKHQWRLKSVQILRVKFSFTYYYWLFTLRLEFGRDFKLKFGRYSETDPWLMKEPTVVVAIALKAWVRWAFWNVFPYSTNQFFPSGPEAEHNFCIRWECIIVCRLNPLLLARIISSVRSGEGSENIWVKE